MELNNFLQKLLKVSHTEVKSLQIRDAAPCVSQVSEGDEEFQTSAFGIGVSYRGKTVKVTELNTKT